MKKYLLFVGSLNSKIFLLSFIMAIGICSILGRYVAQESYYVNFHRLGGAHSNDVAFNITASQVATLVRDSCSKDKILVVIGGSSVMFGVGQPVRALWSDQLQRLLGANYCVINLAFPAGGLSGYASIIANSVGREYKDVFLISDTVTPASDADGGIWNKHFFWDAYYKGFFKDSLISFSARDIDQINQINLKYPPKDRDRIEQLKLGMWLDSLLYFNDLWSYVDYKYMQTIYNPMHGIYQWKPRFLLPDYDYEVDIQRYKLLKDYPALDSEKFKGDFLVVRGFRDAYFYEENQKFELKKSYLYGVDEQIKSYPLTKISNKIILVFIPESPYYTSRMSKDEQKDYIKWHKKRIELWGSYGYQTLDLGGMLAEDYGDRVHLNPLGGEKLAKSSARLIEEITHK